MKIFYNIKETAILLGISEKTISRWVHSGKIQANVYGTRLIRVPSIEIDRLKKEFENSTLIKKSVSITKKRQAT